MSGPGAQNAAPTTRGLPLQVLLWATIVVGAVVCALSVVSGVLDGSLLGERSSAGLVIAAVLTYLGLRSPITLRLRSEAVYYTWAEIGFLLAVATDARPAVVAASAAGAALSFAGRQSWQKVAFNTAVIAVSGAAALGVARLVAGDNPGTDTARGLFALFLCGLTHALCTELATDLVVSTAQRVRFRVVALGNVGLDQFILLGNLAVGTGFAVLLTWSTWAAALLPGAVWVTARIHSSGVRMREHEQAFRDLQDATEMLSRLDGREVLRALVTGAARLCRAELVEVVLADGTVLRGDADNILPSAEITALPHMTTAALSAGGQHLGEIRLRFAEEIALTEAERRALSTLAAVGGVAIANARQHERTRYDATHDPLTDLPNRRALMDAADAALRRDAARVALFVIDLDRFKEVNDTLGHMAGDALLCVTAGRLREALGDDGLVARLGGDEFAVLLPTTTPAALTAIADRVRAVLAMPVRLDAGATEVAVTVIGSIGVATAVSAEEPGAGVGALELLRRADVAMYRAKGNGGGVTHYGEGSDPMSLQRLLLEPELRAAVADPGQLVVEYQPQLDFATGAPVGAEALVRWNHPVYGVLHPDVIIPAVERCGLDRVLTMVVLERAVAARVRWVDDYGVDVRIAVNVAPRTMLDRTFPDAVRDVLRRYRTAPERLVVEVPETVAVTDLDAVSDVLGGLHRLGVQIALDDFGTGGAPLTLLARMPVDEVKIDRSFVGEMARNPTAEAIVRATVDLARGLGLRTVAEGVESTTVEQALRDLGCDAGQGFRYARPVDEAAAGVSMRDAQRDARTRSSAGVVRLAAVRRRPRSAR
ncbi:MAG: diguanylate cyclase [Cryptosporangiaceae bacterium]|jgi:diguanylate cyclase (GGDEF)-like protein|nr:diguanylate cyclase [Cryptosporangiaceae bacterium]